ncbi:hypothetical protein BpHYR1_015797 [Brachionus plicatilis]|uniref:Uncharacterized protein n=1 Tax=Brachionus plicatilis TaxID=10195 RepID=A0A3M7T3K4_BRAPC|nr:hypothetical protein BpHYR1_015797 [Brachionus plicatilis]
MPAFYLKNSIKLNNLNNKVDNTNLISNYKLFLRYQTRTDMTLNGISITNEAIKWKLMLQFIIFINLKFLNKSFCVFDYN